MWKPCYPWRRRSWNDCSRAGRATEVRQSNSSAVIRTASLRGRHRSNISRTAWAACCFFVGGSARGVARPIYVRAVAWKA